MPECTITVSLEPTAGFFGEQSFTFEACDPDGRCGSGEIRISVTSSNRPPKAVDDRVRVERDSSARVVVLTNDSDPDGDDLEVTEMSEPRRGEVEVGSDGVIEYTPDRTGPGQDTFTHTIADTEGATDTATVTILVLAPDVPNEPPIGLDDDGNGFRTPEDTTLVTADVTRNDSDPDHPIDPASIEVLTDVVHGSLTPNGDGTLT